MAYKDAEIEVMTPLEALWTKIKESSEGRIESMEEALIVEKAMVEMAKVKIEESK